MKLDEFYISVKDNFPDISEKADKLYDDYWNRYVEMEFSEYSWFEFLANALNSEMQKGVDVSNYIELFEYVRHSYMIGDVDVKNTVDVAFVENLFWQVPKEKAEPYWEKFPEILKKLYINFHRRAPF
ncbi:hypothetical protein KCM76_25640 [Zooshikella marina]|uniref:DUF7674 family protein n=1 Tax=Zooshikella ganghwensis TaxID=202772 RepID=UPI001BAF6CA4|nr:hypothetical protein [Zooshikella ganghwensis]MBU2709400.1 hypothetical protein [Zooshikella ganghwensis]